MTAKRYVWCAFVLVVLCVHLVVGTLLAIATAFYWLIDKKLTANKPRPRLSDTREIQLAYQQALAAITYEAIGKDAGIALPTVAQPKGTIEGARLLVDLENLDAKGTQTTAGFKPEHIKVLKTLTFLLANCAQLEATKANLKIFQPLFNFSRPIGPELADAYDEVIRTLVSHIEPNLAQAV